jgi:hypothetical protein
VIGIPFIVDYTVIQEQFDTAHVYKSKGAKMKKTLLSIFGLFLLLAACSPQAAATEFPGEVGGGATPPGDNSTTAHDAAVAALSKNLGLDPGQIKVVSAEAVEWPDACLGVTLEGMACAQVVSPGYKIILEANGKQVEYHTNLDGSVVVPATAALTWSRNGGITGFCDSLTIYLSGEVQGSNCKSSEMVEKNISELLSPEEIATMNEWISKYGKISIDASDPKGAADAMSVKLTMYGTGTQQNMVQASQQIMLTFVQDLYQELMSK